KDFEAVGTDAVSAGYKIADFGFKFGALTAVVIAGIAALKSLGEIFSTLGVDATAFKEINKSLDELGLGFKQFKEVAEASISVVSEKIQSLAQTLGSQLGISQETLNRTGIFFKRTVEESFNP